MIAMQYNISLPSDYDMEIIRQRTRNNGSKTDGFPDLKMKAYLIAEKCKYNNYENQYSPFYLWEKEEGMNTFLLGGYFNNILNSFGWTQVRNWIVLHEHIKKSLEQQYVSIQTMPIQPFTDFSTMCNSEKENYCKWITDASTTSYITAYSPFTWEMCRFHMTTDLEILKQTAKNSLIFDVHHIS